MQVSAPVRKMSAACLGLMLLAGGAFEGTLRAESGDPHSGAGSDLAFWEELAFWETIKDSTDPGEFDAYLLTYPKGRFAPVAEVRRDALAKKAAADQEALDGPSTAESPPDANQNQVTASGDDASSEADRLFRDCEECPLMVEIPPGRFQMGSDRNRPEERPAHEVSIAQPFAIGVFEVSIQEWDACLREGSCSFGPKESDNELNPVNNLSWDDAQQYVSWLSKKTGAEYRLPTEAEWEYAAASGAKTRFWWGDSVGANNANCKDCGSQWDGKSQSPVGSFEANAFGLYDVHGNLWEWTMDCWNGSYKRAPSDGSALLRGDCLARVLRGGSWKLESDYMRTTRRNRYDRDVRYYLHGLRVVKSLR